MFSKGSFVMKILNYGSMNIDNVYQVDHMIQPGETQMAQAKNVFAGGKGLNQSIAIAKAGGAVYHAGVVGEDGAILMDTLTKGGVDTQYIKHMPGPSGHTVIQVDKNGQNSIIVFAGENMRVLREDIEKVLSGFEKGDLLILQNELDNSPLIMRMASERGMTIVFNPSPVNEGLHSYPLECVDWFLLNEIEGKALTDETEPDKILAVLKERYPKAGVVLTLGSDGAYCVRGDEKVFQPVFPVKAVDTTAAGDTFTGYFVTGVSRGDDLVLVMKRAAKASSIAVSRPGAADSIPSFSEVEI